MTEKLIAAIGVFILAITLSGCGETAQSVSNENLTISADMTAQEFIQHLDSTEVSEELATRQAESLGLTVRVASRDGDMFPMTMDYRENRINLTVENNQVVSATIG